MSSLKQLICGLRGHEEYLHFQKDRVSLQCLACGHETPGWTTGRRKYSEPTQLTRVEKVARVRPLIRKVA